MDRISVGKSMWVGAASIPRMEFRIVRGSHVPHFPDKALVLSTALVPRGRLCKDFDAYFTDRMPSGFMRHQSFGHIPRTRRSSLMSKMVRP